MSIIKVLTRRVIAKKDFHKCKSLLNNLYKEAYNHNGFLGASTYVESHNNFIKVNSNINSNKCTHDNIWTISKWTSSFEWNNWHKSQLRINNIEKYNEYIEKETHTIIRKVKQDVFLL